MRYKILKYAISLLFLISSSSQGFFDLGGLFVNYMEDSEKTSQNVTIDYDSFKKILSITGPSDTTNGDIFLRSSGNNNKERGLLLHQIYIITNKKKWHYFDEAYDSEGKKLDLTVISRDVGNCGSYGCFLHESIGINLTDDELKQIENTGIAFKIYGKNKDGVSYKVSSKYIKGYLNAIDKYFKK